MRRRKCATLCKQLVERVNYGATDPDAVDKENKREFVCKLLPCYMSKMVTRAFASFSDAVDEALKLEQLTAVKRDAQERAALWER